MYVYTYEGTWNFIGSINIRHYSYVYVPICTLLLKLFAKNCKICIFFFKREKKCSLDLIDLFYTNQMHQCELFALRLLLNWYYTSSRFPFISVMLWTVFSFKCRFFIISMWVGQVSMFHVYFVASNYNHTLSLSFLNWIVVIAYIHMHLKRLWKRQEITESIDCFMSIFLMNLNSLGIGTFRCFWHLNEDFLRCIYSVGFLWPLLLILTVNISYTISKMEIRLDMGEHFPIKNSVHLNKAHRI